MTTFYSVDVETTNTVVTDNALLSIGIQVVHDDLSLGDDFYVTLRHPHLAWDEDTLAFWRTVDTETYYASRENPTSLGMAVYDLRAFVLNTNVGEGKPCFVANPVAFDKPWIDHLFYVTNTPNPFDYRSLCLRSMHYGLEDVEWGQDREKWGKFCVEPEQKHHALSDAKAQAQELILMLTEKRSRGKA